ncbi:MAG: SusD/RagB family nutrient-binding outer membrane lipoprotein [Bacteroidales bacterium]|nr:SusD/RagB family nutrient-binding outer membrane lipoprotein [Bacteroidales bacterium]
MKKLIPIIIIFVYFLSSCDNWLDINTDPNNPSEVEVNKLLPGINSDIGYYLGNRYMALGYITSVYTHQLTSRESIDQYGINGSDVDNTWAGLYVGPVKDIETLIEEATSTGNMLYAGIGKIYKAYLFSQMVDIWGDIPYSEASISGNYNPVFDDDVAIYPSLINLLEEAITNLNDQEAENLLVPGNDDIIYNGDIDSWIKVANSLLLKLYVQAASTSVYNQAKVDALLAGELIGEGEDFSIPYGTSQAPDNRNPGFVDEYAGGQISSYISPWFYEIMLGEADHIFSGIADPRVPYYFCTQLNDGDDTENPPEYQNGNFVSIYFGSNGVNSDHAGRNTFTMLGLYPVGGAYDSESLDKSKPLGVSAGTGAAPYRLITYADVLYLQAELVSTGKVTGDLRALLENAIRASFAQVDAVVDVAGKGGEPILSGSAAETDYINAVLSDFDAATAEGKFEILMTQKWISKFGSSIDSYTDYRRTGYPVMWDPNTMVADGGPDGSGVVPTESTRPYVVSFPWSSDELSMNDNAPKQKTISTDKIFWDN